MKEKAEKKAGEAKKFGFLWKAVRRVAFRDIGWTIALIAAILSGAVIQFFPPMVLRRIVDSYMASGDASGVWPFAFLYLFLTVAGELGRALQGYTATRLGSYVLLELRMEMVQRLESLPISFFRKNATGGIMSFFTTDLDAVETIFSSGLLVMIINLFQIIGLAAAVFILSPAVFAAMCVVFPFLFIMTSAYRKVNLRLQSDLRSRTADIGAFLHETYSGVRTIKIFGREKKVKQQAQPILEAWYRPLRSLALLSSSFPVIRQTLWAITVSLVVWIGGPTGLPFSEGLSAGTLAALMDMVIRIFWPIEALSQQVFTLQQAIAGLSRISSYFRQATEERCSPEAGTLDIRPAVHVEKLAYGYEPGFPVLEDISFTISPGSKVAFAGRTGAGKTTLMNLLGGLYKPWQGSIHIGGRDPFSMKPEERRKHIGVVPQQTYVLNGTVRENITLRDPAISEEAVVRAMNIVELHDDMMKFPKGYDTMLGEGETQLSFGQCQLLCLAKHHRWKKLNDSTG